MNSVSVKSIMEENEQLRNENFSLRMQVFHLSSSSNHSSDIVGIKSASSSEMIDSSQVVEENNSKLLEIIKNLQREIESQGKQYLKCKSEMQTLKKDNEMLRQEIKTLKLENIKNKFEKERAEIDRVL